MNRSDPITELAAAFVKASGELKNPSFDTTNPFFKNKYASLATVRDTVTPILAKHGLSVIQFLGHKEGGITCETTLLHTSGQWLSETLYMPATKPDAQGYGSAITYARRYALMALCGVVGDEDDDGNGAVKGKAYQVAPMAGAHEGVTKEQKAKVEGVYSSVLDAFEAGWVPEKIVEMIDKAGLDTDERVYLASLEYSKEQKAALKKAVTLKREQEKKQLAGSQP